MNGFISMLEAGDLKSVDRVPDLINLVADQPDLFPQVIQAMDHTDGGVRKLASEAVEKITRSQPEYLQPHKAFLLKQVSASGRGELRWHLTQIVPRLDLTPAERSRAAEHFFTFLEDPSQIVQSNTLQALVDLAWEDDELFGRVKTAVEQLAGTSSPAGGNQAAAPHDQLPAEDS